MNRLILIGNGFDLAHGLKTSYNDFILWYLKKTFRTAEDKRVYDDNLINIQKRQHAGDIIVFREKRTTDQLVTFCYEQGLMSQLIDNLEFIQPNTRNLGFTETSTFIVTVKSRLFRHLLLNCSPLNWVDIENEFYEQLKRILSLNVVDSDKKK